MTVVTASSGVAAVVPTAGDNEAPLPAACESTHAPLRKMWSCSSAWTKISVAVPLHVH